MQNEPTPSPSPDSAATPAELRFGGSWKMIVPFALLPIVIVAAAVGVFLLFGRLADNQLGPQNYLNKLQSASTHQRWQAAYELAGYLARGDVGERRPEFERQMLNILASAKPDEARLKQYLLLGLGQVGSEASLEPILKLAADDANSEVQIYALLALGRIGSPKARPLVLEKLRSDDAGLRKTAAFAMGAVGGPQDVAALEKLLQDDTADVRWNAALALARLGSSAGKGEILRLLDPEELKQATPHLRDSERAQIVVSAINAAGQLHLAEATLPLRTLQDSAPDPFVREAARRALGK